MNYLMHRHRLVWSPAWVVTETWLVRDAWLAALVLREAAGSRCLLPLLAFRWIVFLH